jgi:aminoglycoside phosphotransferase (APT) family kinase protein
MFTPDELERLSAFMAETLHTPTCEIRNAVRIQGGASRETLRFDAVTPDRIRGFIMRRDPPKEKIITERRVEFAALRSFHDSRVPVPRPIALVEDDKVLGRPFMVIQRIDNAFPLLPFLPDPFGPHRESIGKAFFSILGAIHKDDPEASDLAAQVDVPKPRACWKRELDHWEGVIEGQALEPQPVAMAAIRRLRRNPPPPPKRLAVVHGDYRNGNFLTDGKGGISAILDWELAHIGDPHEDLAWALDPLWAGKNGYAAGMLEFDEAISLWSAASGCEFDADAFRWWSLFSNIKGIGIWLSCARRYQEKELPDALLGFSGWYCLLRHNKIIADRLAGAARGALA